MRNLGHIENLSLYLDTKLIFLILEILAIETFLHVFVLVTTSSIFETGRYTHPITPVENRICSNCNSKSVEDEIHFLMYCPKFENLRRELFSNVLNYNAAILSAEDKFVWILSNEDPSCVRELAKFIHSCFQMAP